MVKKNQIKRTLLQEVMEKLEAINFKYYDYSEYRSIPRPLLRDYYFAKLLQSFESDLSEIIISGNNGRIDGLAILEREPFDTEIFGYPNYKCNIMLLLDENINSKRNTIKHLILEVDEYIKKNDQKAYLLVSLNNNNPDSIIIMNELISYGYYYLHTLITFGFMRSEFDSLHFSNDPEIVIRPAEIKDVEHIVSLAMNSFYYSRFHLDPSLDKNKANKLLGTSAYNSVVNHFVDIVLVAELNGKLVGYYSGKKKLLKELSMQLGEAVISAVDTNMRGHGIFKELNRELIAWFRQNTDFAEMGTYLGNTPVLRTWTKNGLSIVRGTHQLSKNYSL